MLLAKIGCCWYLGWSSPWLWWQQASLKRLHILYDCMAQHPRRYLSSFSPRWERKVSLIVLFLSFSPFSSSPSHHLLPFFISLSLVPLFALFSCCLPSHSIFIFVSFLQVTIVPSCRFLLVAASIFPSPTSYWTNPSANLYSNIAAASSHSMTHHPSHVTSHLGSYPHYAWPDPGWTREYRRLAM